jgi:3-hydroxymyristoyl/3-hydroxydecanoyl-(acyl carrier protein) dehydratases
MESELNIQDIMKRLPHRYPFLLVDRVLHVEVGKSLRAIKNVTMNEPFFQGHFPAMPVMPGVLIIEALAQAAALLAFVSEDKYGENAAVYFAGIDKARFANRSLQAIAWNCWLTSAGVARECGKWKPRHWWMVMRWLRPC